MRSAGTARPGAAAFTIVEALVASIVLVLLAVGTLTAVGATASAQQSAADRVRGRFIADDLMAEIVKQAYVEGTNYGAALGPEAGEVSGSSRAAFDDVDDYHLLVETPPRFRDGSSIPGLADWSRQTRVSWVTDADTAVISATETYLKMISVTVLRKGKPVAVAVALRSAAWDNGERIRKTTVSTASDTSVGPTP